jgi:hypothetical protein
MKIICKQLRKNNSPLSWDGESYQFTEVDGLFIAEVTRPDHIALMLSNPNTYEAVPVAESAPAPTDTKRRKTKSVFLGETAE